MASYDWPPRGSGGGGVPVYTTLSAFPDPTSVSSGSLAVAADTGILYESNAVAWRVVGGPGVPLSIGSPANGLGISASVLSLGLSSTSTTGALSSADWNTFNGKQSALTFGNLTDDGTDGITITGGSGAVIGSGAAISQHVSDSTHNGYLSSTDWGTFNSKQAGPLTGDVTTSGAAATLATVNANAGSFGSSTAIPAFTVNGKGLITAASLSAVIAPAGTLTGATLASNVLASSLTSVGTIAAGVWSGTPVAPTSGGTGLTTYTTGDVLYASAANTLSKLPIGSSGQFLGISAGVPAWGAVPATALVVKSKTANYTILSTDNVILASGSAFTLTLPAASTVQILYIKKTDSSLSNIITIARAGSDTIDGATSTTLNTLNETITLVSDGSTTWQILDRQSVGIWTQYTPTLTGFGTASSVSFWWKRLGDSMIIRGYFVAGTSTAVAAKASLPSGAALSFSSGVDSSILGLGVFTAQNSSASAAVISNNGGVIFSDASDTGNLFFGQSSSAGGQSTIAKLNGSSVALSSWGVSLANIIIPISGWN